MTSTNASTDFDVLRREATKLERHLEDKVSRYQQLAQKLNSTDQSLDSLLHSAETGTSTNNILSMEEELALRNDITRTLSLLQDLIQSKMAPAAEKSTKSQHYMLLVKRYREILFDLTSDYQKTSAQLVRKREQMELFAGSSNNGIHNHNADQDEATQHLMRERNHISNSLTTSASIIHQATEIHSDLRNQGMSLRNVQSVMVRMTSNIPGLNRLVDNIRRRRNRDDVIVAAVIAACILFTLWYMFG